MLRAILILRRITLHIRVRQVHTPRQVQGKFSQQVVYIRRMRTVEGHLALALLPACVIVLLVVILPVPASRPFRSTLEVAQYSPKVE